jgi:hypothetical protein
MLPLHIRSLVLLIVENNVYKRRVVFIVINFTWTTGHGQMKPFNMLQFSSMAVATLPVWPKY